MSTSNIKIFQQTIYHLRILFFTEVSKISFKLFCYHLYAIVIFCLNLVFISKVLIRESSKVLKMQNISM